MGVGDLIQGFFIRNIVNRFVWPYLKGFDGYTYFKELKKLEKNSIEKNVQIQKKKLFDLINHAHKNIPYYKKIIENKNITYSEDTIFEDIKKFPVLTKKTIKDNLDDLCDVNLLNKAYLSTSGGSTGEPVVFYQNLEMKNKVGAFTILCYEWAGRKEGECLIRLWGDEKDILNDSKDIDWFMVKYLKNIEFLNGFRMNKNIMKNYVELINKRKPKVIEAYVLCIYELTKFIKENNIKVYSPKGIITCSEMLYPEMKDEIESVFKCKVYNKYASREAGNMAFNCEKEEGLHINIFNHYLEILDEELDDVEPGKHGIIYITTLNNYVMPLIRYDTGDLAVPKKEERCSCGRGMPLIEGLKGRVMNSFKTKKGEIIYGGFFVTLFYMKSWVKKFKVVQKDYEFIVIFVVGTKMEKEMVEIENSIKRVMGENCKIKWEFVKKIPPLKSGKYLYAFSELQ